MLSILIPEELENPKSLIITEELKIYYISPSESDGKNSTAIIEGKDKIQF